MATYSRPSKAALLLSEEGRETFTVIDNLHYASSEMKTRIMERSLNAPGYKDCGKRMVQAQHKPAMMLRMAGREVSLQISKIQNFLNL